MVVEITMVQFKQLRPTTPRKKKISANIAYIQWHVVPILCRDTLTLSYVFLSGMYSKRRRSNVAVIIVRVIFISSFLFYCLLLNHSFQTNPNKITNCLKLFSLFTTLQLHCSCVAFWFFEKSRRSIFSQWRWRHSRTFLGWFFRLAQVYLPWPQTSCLVHSVVTWLSLFV